MSCILKSKQLINVWNELILNEDTNEGALPSIFRHRKHMVHNTMEKEERDQQNRDLQQPSNLHFPLMS